MRAVSRIHPCSVPPAMTGGTFRTFTRPFQSEKCLPTYWKVVHRTIAQYKGVTNRFETGDSSYSCSVRTPYFHTRTSHRSQLVGDGRPLFAGQDMSSGSPNTSPIPPGPHPSGVLLRPSHPPTASSSIYLCEYQVEIAKYSEWRPSFRYPSTECCLGQ